MRMRKVNAVRIVLVLAATLLVQCGMGLDAPKWHHESFALYVANKDSKTVSHYEYDNQGRFYERKVHTLAAAGSYMPTSVAVDPDGDFLVVGFSDGSTAGGVELFSVDPVSGALTSVDYALLGRAIKSVAVHPTANHVYAVGVSAAPSSDAFSESYGQSGFGGGWSSVIVEPAASSAEMLGVHPSGAYIYIGHTSATGVNVVALDVAHDVTGGPTAVAPSGAVTTDLVFHPFDASFFGIAKWTSPYEVWSYKNFNPSNGQAPGCEHGTSGTCANLGFEAPANPSAIAISPYGEFVYVVGANNGGNSQLAAYWVDRTNYELGGEVGTRVTLPYSSTATLAGSLAWNDVVVSPSGAQVIVSHCDDRALYVTDFRYETASFGETQRYGSSQVCPYAMATTRIQGTGGG